MSSSALVGVTVIPSSAWAFRGGRTGLAHKGLAVVCETDEDDRDPDLDNNADTITFEIDRVAPITINVKPGVEPNAINNRRNVDDAEMAEVTASPP